MSDAPDPALCERVTIEGVRAAADRIRGVAHRTPVLTSAQADERVRGRVLFKCENLQRTGSFKIRGAYSALSRLGPRERARGVLAYSSGNHAQAVALGARLLGIRASIIMPSDAPEGKRRATEAYLGGAGGEVIPYDRARTTREELARELVERHGLTLIPPYDHPDVICGQGTTALELFEQVERGGIASAPGVRAGAGDAGPGLDALYVCCGGGGLLSGCATVSRALAPGCRVIGVEPERADDAARSFRTGRLHSVHNPETIADGARTPSLGRHTFPIVLERVDEMLVVSEREIARATLWVLERMKLVVEPTGALATAGLFRHAEAGARAGERVGVVLSGGNLDPARIPEVTDLAEPPIRRTRRPDHPREPPAPADV